MVYWYSEAIVSSPIGEPNNDYVLWNLQICGPMMSYFKAPMSAIQTKSEGPLVYIHNNEGLPC